MKFDEVTSVFLVNLTREKDKYSFANKIYRSFFYEENLFKPLGLLEYINLNNSSIK